MKVYVYKVSNTNSPLQNLQGFETSCANTGNIYKYCTVQIGLGRSSQAVSSSLVRHDYAVLM